MDVLYRGAAMNFLSPQESKLLTVSYRHYRSACPHSILQTLPSCLPSQYPTDITVLPALTHYPLRAKTFRKVIVHAQNCKKRLLASSCPSVRPISWKNSAPTGRIFVETSKYFSKICRENSSFIKI